MEIIDCRCPVCGDFRRIQAPKNHRGKVQFQCVCGHTINVELNGESSVAIWPLIVREMKERLTKKKETSDTSSSPRACPVCNGTGINVIDGKKIPCQTCGGSG